MFDCLSPSATRIADARLPSASVTDALRIRSAVICRVIASWISGGAAGGEGRDADGTALPGAEAPPRQKEGVRGDGEGQEDYKLATHHLPSRRGDAAPARTRRAAPPPRRTRTRAPRGIGPPSLT